MDKVRVAVIGIGNRGKYMLENCLLDMNNMCVTAVCDTYADRTQWAVDAVVRHGGQAPFASTDMPILKKYNIKGELL